MKKVIIIGCPGSGKSTFARELQKITGLPLYYLDMIKHKPDKSEISREEFIEKLSGILEKDEWIIDGNYLRTIPLRLEKCDTVFWLDYPVSICLSGAESRLGKERPDMPWIETERDEVFMQYIKDFNTVSRQKILTILENAKDKNIYVFNSREESDVYLTRFGFKDN